MLSCSVHYLTRCLSVHLQLRWRIDWERGSLLRPTSVRAHTDMVIEIHGVILVYGSKIPSPFNREAAGHIGSQNWSDPIFQSIGTQHKPQAIFMSIHPTAIWARTRLTLNRSLLWHYPRLSLHFIGNWTCTNSHPTDSTALFTDYCLQIVNFYLVDRKEWTKHLVTYVFVLSW